MSWRSFALKSLLAWTVVMLGACVNAPTHPVGLGIPEANPTDLFAVYDITAKTLDCLSGEIRAAGADDEKKKARIALGTLPNAVGPKVGRVDLPPSLQPFARRALDRITSGIAIIDESNSHNTPLLSDPKGIVPPPNLPLSDDPKDVVQFRLNGSIYTAAPFRVLENELQALGFGAGTHVEATDIGIQLYWQARVSKLTFQQSGTSVSMMIRVYSAEQGASAFRVTAGSNGLVMARSRAAQEATTPLAIQSAVNIGVGMLIKARASRDWGVASACPFPKESTAIPVDPTPPPAPLISVRLVLHKGELCAVITPINLEFGKPTQPPTLPGPLALEIVESRGEGIEIRRRTARLASLEAIVTSQRSVCFPQGAFDVRTEQVQFFFSSPGGRNLGAGAYVF